MQSRRQFLFTGLRVAGGLGFAGVASLVSERRSFCSRGPARDNHGPVGKDAKHLPGAPACHGRPAARRGLH
jgi:hypothetical protein